MRSPAELVLLTEKFPFGFESEPFLESELEILAERFSRVFLLPSHRADQTRKIPPNATIVQMGWLEEPTREAKLGALRSAAAAQILLVTLGRRRNWRPYLFAGRLYLDLLARNILKFRLLRRFLLEHQASPAVFYDYWFENSTLALALLRRSGLIPVAVARAHRFDVYDEAWGGRPVPFSDFKAEHLDSVFPVSRFTDEYLRKRVPALEGKTRVCRLGVRRQPWTDRTPSEPPLVLSCSRLLPRKRVHLIPQVLSCVGRPLRWVHLGDGPERPRLLAAITQASANVSCELLGQLPNTEVLRFYRSHEVSALLSLSDSEGLPVSMMEALSFGIPVVATCVHGIPEIVNSTTGILMSPNATIAEMAAAVTEALRPARFASQNIQAFFLEHFEASRNFNQFADVLLDLRAEINGERPR